MLMNAGEVDVCSQYTAMAKRAAGWGFANLFHQYFGPGTIVLVGEGPNGTNLEFTVNEDWLQENNIRNFTPPRESIRLSRHIEQCRDQRCCAAHQMLNAVAKYLEMEKLPDRCAIVVVSRLKAKLCCVNELRFERVRGWGDVIDELRPFLRWFSAEPLFWITPNQQPTLPPAA